MTISQKKYASKAGVSGMKKVNSRLNLSIKNFNRMQSQIRKIILNYQEITEPNKILNEIRKFYESLFKKGDTNPPSQINDFSFKN